MTTTKRYSPEVRERAVRAGVRGASGGASVDGRPWTATPVGVRGVRESVDSHAEERESVDSHAGVRATRRPRRERGVRGSPGVREVREVRGQPRRESQRQS